MTYEEFIADPLLVAVLVASVSKGHSASYAYHIALSSREELKKEIACCNEPSTREEQRNYWESTVEDILENAGMDPYLTENTGFFEFVLSALTEDLSCDELMDRHFSPFLDKYIEGLPNKCRILYQIAKEDRARDQEKKDATLRKALR